MRTLGTTLAALLLCAPLLAGCGEEAEVQTGEDTSTSETPTSDAAETPAGTPAETPAGTPAETPAATPTSTPSSTPSDGDAAEPVDYDVVALPSATAAGGTVSPMLTPVGTPDELEAFVSQFRLEDFAEQVRSAAVATSYDGELWAGVVSLGCDVPPGVFVEEGEAGYLVTPQRVADPLDNCVAPVTTVALVAIR